MMTAYRMLDSPVFEMPCTMVQSTWMASPDESVTVSAPTMTFTLAVENIENLLPAVAVRRVCSLTGTDFGDVQVQLVVQGAFSKHET